MTSKTSNQHLCRIENLLLLQENRQCFECFSKQPRWASTNLGVFICIRCAGIHRAMGTHISKVRSANMDTWEESMVQCCERIGNSRGRLLYEHGMPANIRPTPASDTAVVERFIREKYERRLYYNPQYEAMVRDFLSSSFSPPLVANTAEEDRSGLLQPVYVETKPATSVPMLWGGSSGEPSSSSVMVAPAPPADNVGRQSRIDINDLFDTTSTTTHHPQQRQYTINYHYQRQQMNWALTAGSGTTNYNHNHNHHEQQQQPAPAHSQLDAKTEILSLFGGPPNQSSTHVYGAWQPRQHSS